MYLITCRSHSPLLLVLLVAFSISPMAAEPVSDTTGGGSCVAFGEPFDAEAQRALAELERGDHAALWSRGDRLESLVAQLRALVDDGLDPAAYYLPVLARQVKGATLDPCTARLASFAYLSALGHLAHGRLDPARRQLFWYADGMAPDRSLASILPIARAGLDDPAIAFQRARPERPRYRHLRAAYRAYRQSPPSYGATVPPGPELRPGERGQRVVALRQRLQRLGYAVAGDVLFDENLEAALRAFQRDYSLEVDGVLGPRTLAALNVSGQQRLEQLRVNLERLRWLADAAEPRMVLVDIAGAELGYYRDGELLLRSRIQSGLPSRATPPLKSRISHVSVNPRWTVPPGILKRDVLPKVRDDITYLEKQRLQVLDPEGNRLDPTEVDWRDPGPIMLRQQSGPNGALGQVALRFDNPFTVYLHETPSKNLFATAHRFYSSGCVRVEDAMALTRLLFHHGDDPERLERLDSSLAAGRTENIHLPAPVPLVMAYWTAEAGPRGNISFRPDIYNRDAALADALQTVGLPSFPTSTGD